MVIKAERGPNNKRALDVMSNLDKIFDTAQHRAMIDTRDKAFEISQTTCPSDRGFLQDSGFVHQDGSIYIVGYSAKHARMIHEGVRPHRIPKTGNKFMAWELGRKGRLARRQGSKHAKFGFAHHVQHPGTSPNPWLLRAVKKAKRMFPYFMKKRFAQAVKEARV